MKRKQLILSIPILFSVLLVIGCKQMKTSSEKDLKGIIFPRAFSFAIDDMGWMIGENAGDIDKQGPYRIGIDRNMDIADYQCIVEVGKQVGVRIQGLFVLAEMDRNNLLANHPSTTWKGKQWNNAKHVSPEQIEIINFVKESAAFLEFGLHGVGHEFWVDGVKKRAEWYCTDDNHPWPEESAQEHIQCFKDIMAQYQLSPEHGHSFPQSFVPCAYGYYWNPTGNYSTGKLMAQAGVKYVNTLFDYITELNPPNGPNGGGFDHGVLVVNRINYGNDWYKLSALPTVNLRDQESDIIESHWSNWLAQDAFLQPQTNQAWVDYYRMVQRSSDRYIAKNTEQHFSQWLYKKYTSVNEPTMGFVSIDNTKMPEEAYRNKLLGNMVLKVKLDTFEHINHASINGMQIPCYFEDEGYGFLYMPMLERKTYELRYSVGTEKMDSYIFNRGTYNIYSFTSIENEVKAEIRLYGVQEIDIYGIAEPLSIEVQNANIEVLGFTYNTNEKRLTVNLKAQDIQGESGTLLVRL